MDSGSVYEGMDKEQIYEEHREAFLNQPRLLGCLGFAQEPHPV